MEFIKSWKTLTAIASGIIVISGALVILGIEFPRPAWASEIKELSGYIVEVDNKVTSEQLDKAKLQLYRNLRESADYRDRGERIPSFINQERVMLERSIDELQTHLDYLRSNDSDQ